ncbi:TIGR01777 family oxidoreductase [Pedobacter deserti]|uniref:TIGR01777 family oxidoreductase n=1 Tax=Pedobacter deserti TaxID=2817382 RepID=UPI00210A5E72|nr:TIGR01777 family oxidoreductase [Pedobacter sp. SYSU D00382]
MAKQILITGATGMIGKKLIAALQDKGYGISVLSRAPHASPDVKTYLWNISSGKIDPACLDGVEAIIHLAGENVAAKKWTEQQKQRIVDSRVKSTELLYKTIKQTGAPVQVMISASAVGYYGDSGDEILTETATPGYDFLASCCQQWEEAVDRGRSLGLRIVKLRTGVVLDKSSGALSALEKPIRLFVGAPIGTGRQWVPWIHIDDIVNMYVGALSDPLYLGAYNACAPFPVTNETLTKQLAKKLSRPAWPIHVPEKVMQMIMGEMSSIVLMSSNTSAQKILDQGFQFRYTYLEDALHDIYGK